MKSTFTALTLLAAFLLNFAGSTYGYVEVGMKEQRPVLEDPTGLLNEGMRYRCLETGVFLTRDPAGFVDGPNVYTYVRQNPWSAYDAEGLFLGFVADAGFAIYGTYQYARGNISGAEFSGRMALTGASLVANAASGGTAGLAVRGASMAARAGSVAVKAAKAVDRTNTAVQTAQSVAEHGGALASSIGEGDVRGIAKAAAGLGLEAAGGKKVDGSLGATSQRKTRAQTKAQVEVAAPKTTGTRGYRYMTEGEIQAIKDTGMLRGGNPGETFFTKDVFKSADKAQRRLSLPSKPTHRVEFEITNNLTLQRNGTKVKPGFGQPGKGAEFMTTDPVRANIINSQPLR